MTVDSMSLKNLRVDTANIEADLPFLAKFLNVCIKAGIPRLNTWLKQNTFKIPNRIAGIFNITDLTMAYHENYLDIGVTPVFHPIFEEIDERFLPFIPIDDEPFYLAENKAASQLCSLSNSVKRASTSRAGSQTSIGLNSSGIK